MSDLATQKKHLEEKIIRELKDIYDPEVPVNIYDIGLIYELKIGDDFFVKVVMTLTTPNCPVAESLPGEVRERVKNVNGVTGVELELTFEPPWTMEMLSDEARLELGMI
jgi:FeS assembly SUF system protein